MPEAFHVFAPHILTAASASKTLPAAKAACRTSQSCLRVFELTDEGMIVDNT